jgi:hypothetical protein
MNTDEIEELEGWRKLLVLVVLLIFCWLVVIGAVTVCKHIAEYFKDERVVEYIAPSSVVERMKFHGVEIAFEDYEGKLYFVREGERCEL